MAIFELQIFSFFLQNCKKMKITSFFVFYGVAFGPIKI
jgi:hypothetical protein